MLVDYSDIHTQTPAGSLQSNGQVDCIVQVVQRSLQKMCEAEEVSQEWEKYLVDLVLGYNASVQASTGCAPYTLVFGVTPVFMAAGRE